MLTPYTWHVPGVKVLAGLLVMSLRALGLGGLPGFLGLLPFCLPATKKSLVEWRPENIRLFNGCEVQIENSVMRITVWNHKKKCQWQNFQFAPNKHLIWIHFLHIQATLVISTPDNSIPSLISKWNESPNFFLYIVIAFRLWISQSMDNLKLWISQSGFSVPNCKLRMFILLLISKC